MHRLVWHGATWIVAVRPTLFKRVRTRGVQPSASCFVSQIHRRGRALRKLAKQLTEGTVVLSSRSLQNYIMPYAMTALFDEKMLKVSYTTH